MSKPATALRNATSEEIAWAAGLFEGEGNINTTGGKKLDIRNVALRINMTDPDVLHKFATIIGVGNVIPASVRGENRKPLWQWNAGGQSDVIRILEAFLPWLGSRRHAKAQAALAQIQAKRNPPNMRAVAYWNR